jgi:hypothetical protein
VLGAPDSDATLEYTLGPRLAVERVRVRPEFLALHAEFQRKALLDHPHGRHDEEKLLPVLRFDGRGFVALPGAGSIESSER